MLNILLNVFAWRNWYLHREHPLAILYFHRVLSEPDPFCPDDLTAREFDKLLTGLKRHFNIVPVSKALELQKSNSLPSKSLAITFDDGYADNFTNALPIFDKLNLKGSFFVATQGIERGYLWNDQLADAIKKTDRDSFEFLNVKYLCSTYKQRAEVYLNLVSKLKTLSNDLRDRYLQELTEVLGGSIVDRVMMNDKQLWQLQKSGHDVGAHTRTHSILSYQTDEVAESEIVSSISYLNAILNEPVSLFAYPNGWYGRDFYDKHKEMLLRAGVEVGLATNDGGVTSQTSRSALPRFMPFRKEFNQFCLSIEKIAGE